MDQLVKGVVLIDRSMEQCMNEIFVDHSRRTRGRIPENRLELTGTLKSCTFGRRYTNGSGLKGFRKRMCSSRLEAVNFRVNLKAATFLRTAFFPKGTLSVRVQESNNFTRSLQKV